MDLRFRAQFLVLLLPVLLVVLPAYSQRRVRHLGPPSTQSFSKPLADAQALAFMLQRNRADVAAVLRSPNAHWPGNVDDLISAANQKNIEPTTIEVGDVMPWMAMRLHGHPTAAGAWIWAGKTAIKAFRFNFESGGRHWQFIAPALCGNFWVREYVIQVGTGVVDIPSKRTTSTDTNGRLIKGGPITIQTNTGIEIKGGDIKIEGGNLTINATSVTLTGPVTLTGVPSTCTSNCAPACTPTCYCEEEDRSNANSPQGQGKQGEAPPGGWPKRWVICPCKNLPMSSNR